MEQLYIILNFLLCLDLWFILRNPFKPQRRRGFLYYSIAIIFSVMTWLTAHIIRATFYQGLDNQPDNYPYVVTTWPANPENPTSPIDYYYHLISFTVYPIAGITSFILLFRILCVLSRKGTSRTLYRQVCLRYFLFFIFLIPFYLDRLWISVG